MATYTTRKDLEKAGAGAELRAALKAAQGKVVKVKRINLPGSTTSVYVTGEIAMALLDELTAHGNKLAVKEFSLGVSGSNAYVSLIDEKAFLAACHRAGVKVTARRVDNVAAALQAAPGG